MNENKNFTDDVVKKNIKHIKEAVTSGHTEKIKKTSGKTRK